jgi:hypothetical protein
MKKKQDIESYILLNDGVGCDLDLRKRSSWNPTPKILSKQSWCIIFQSHDGSHNTYSKWLHYHNLAFLNKFLMT